MDSENFNPTNSGEFQIVVDVKLKDRLLARLRNLDEFNRTQLLNSEGVDGVKAEIALWQAMEESALTLNRRYAPLGRGNYIIAEEERRVKRIRQRRLAATHILDRQLHEIKAIDVSKLSKKSLAELQWESRRTSEMKLRMSRKEIESKQKKPKGL